MSRLDYIQDWPTLARKCGYRTTTLANRCGVSSRQLQRYFKVALGVAPHEWMRGLRLQRALPLIRRKRGLEGVARQLGYKDHAQFTHAFKDHFGICPSHFAWNPSLLKEQRTKSLP